MGLLPGKIYIEFQTKNNSSSICKGEKCPLCRLSDALVLRLPITTFLSCMSPAGLHCPFSCSRVAVTVLIPHPLKKLSKIKPGPMCICFLEHRSRIKEQCIFWSSFEFQLFSEWMEPTFSLYLWRNSTSILANVLQLYVLLSLPGITELQLSFSTHVSHLHSIFYQTFLVIQSYELDWTG